MAAFSSNVWYQMSETRVGLSSALQYFGGTTVGFFTMNITNDKVKWQILSHSSNTFSFRVENPGPFEQLGVCYVPAEVDPSHTQPCLQETDQGYSGQMWQVESWGDETWKITNVLNGTGYNLDVHPGNPVFLSSDTQPEPIQVGQHWLISSIGVIDDTYWSTSTPSPSPTGHHDSTSSSSASTTPSTPHSASSSPSSQPSTITTAPSLAPAIATQSSGATLPSPSFPASSSSSGGLSTGASIGIGVGVALAALALAALAGLLFLSRRRQQQQHRAALLAEENRPPASPQPFNNYPYAPVQIDGREKRAVSEADGASADASPSPKPPVYEAPVMLPVSELDAGYGAGMEGQGRRWWK